MTAVVTPPLAVGPDRAASWFDDLFVAHASAIHRYFLRRAPHDDAEDLAADVFATAWRRRIDIVDGTELAWLYRTAGYVLANYRRRRSPDVVDSGVLAVQHGSDSSGADPMEGVVLADSARSALLALSTRDREILLLVAWDGVSRVDLAAVLGTSVGGADAALSRARARLRECWPDAVVN